MLGCILLAVAVGLLGVVLPAGLKTSAVDYCLSFLSGGFMNLLSTFIGLMVFLSVVTGICGIGSAAAFGRIGKLMLSRFVGISFLLGAFMTVAIRFIFPLNGGTLGGSKGAIPFDKLQSFFEEYLK